MKRSSAADSQLRQLHVNDRFSQRNSLRFRFDRLKDTTGVCLSFSLSHKLIIRLIITVTCVKGEGSLKDLCFSLCHLSADENLTGIQSSAFFVRCHELHQKPVFSNHLSVCAAVSVCPGFK